MAQSDPLNNAQWPCALTLSQQQRELGTFPILQSMALRFASPLAYRSKYCNSEKAQVLFDYCL